MHGCETIAARQKTSYRKSESIMAPNVSKNSLLSRSNTRISLLPTANNRPSGENESVHAPAGSGNSAAIDDVSKFQMQTTRSYPATAKPSTRHRMHRGCGLAQRHKAGKNIAVRLPVGQIQQYAAPAPRGNHRQRRHVPGRRPCWCIVSAFSDSACGPNPRSHIPASALD